jgi:hypothetical protein
VIGDNSQGKIKLKWLFSMPVPEFDQPNGTRLRHPQILVGHMHVDPTKKAGHPENRVPRFDLDGPFDSRRQI